MIWKSLRSTYSHDLSGHMEGVVAGRHTGKGQGYGWSRMFYLINSHSEQVNCSEYFMYANSLTLVTNPKRAFSTFIPFYYDREMFQ